MTSFLVVAEDVERLVDKRLEFGCGLPSIGGSNWICGSTDLLENDGESSSAFSKSSTDKPHDCISIIM